MPIKYVHNTVRCIYNTDGEFVGFVQNNYLFDTAGGWLGFVQNVNQVYSKQGEFVGYLIDDDRVVRKLQELPKLPVLPPLPPVPALPPLPPLPRFPLAPLPSGYEDVFLTMQSGVFGKGLSKPDLSEYEGMDIVASDGTFLGTVSRNAYDSKSISNLYTYGSQYRSDSLFNSYGKYGGKYSDQSPFNPYGTKPPTIRSKGQPVATLTVNALCPVKMRIVNPTELLLWLGRYVPA